MKLLSISEELKSSSTDINTVIGEIATGSCNQTEETTSCAEISNKFNEEINNSISSLSTVNTSINDS